MNNDPQIICLKTKIFIIEYLGWTIKILLDQIDRINIKKIRHNIGCFSLSNQHNSTYCDTQNLTFVKVDYSIPWMGGIPKLDIGISETNYYKRIIFVDNNPKILHEILDLSSININTIISKYKIIKGEKLKT